MGVFRQVGVWMLVGACAVVVAAPASGQAAAPKKPAAKAVRSRPRTPWGHPDLQGVWNSGTLTPLERPQGSDSKAVLSEEEAAAKEKSAREAGESTPTAGDPGTYNQFWFDQGTKVVASHRASLVIDPPDGRIPAYLPGTQTKVDAQRKRWLGAPSTWMDRDTGERCITDGLPITPLQTYNLNFQILQTPNEVAILAEMYHDLRIVPIDGRAVGTIPQWLGNPRGHWEGETLVVETVTFADRTADIWAWPWRTPSPTLRLVERFTRTDADTIDYQFTISDPTSLSKPFTTSVPLARIDGQIYEYACHEGNYGLRAILSGSFAQKDASVGR